MRDLINVFDSMERDMKRLVDSFPLSRSSFSPQCDIFDRGSHYVLSFDLPGVPKDQIELDVDNGQLRICAQRESQTRSGDYSEKSYGRFERRFTLPENTPVQEIEASFENGVLSVAIPKVESKRAASSKIDIHEGKKEGIWSKLLPHSFGRKSQQPQTDSNSTRDVA